MNEKQLQAQRDMFGITCINCGEEITDETPWGEAEAGPVHLACCDEAT